MDPLSERAEEVHALTAREDVSISRVAHGPYCLRLEQLESLTRVVCVAGDCVCRCETQRT